jgi:hypothetical protein
MHTPSEHSLRLFSTSHPVLYEVHARILVSELSAAEGRPVTLDALPDKTLDAWAGNGFDAVWMMGVWTTGELGRAIARNHEGLKKEFRAALPDLTIEDVDGSPYAVQAYRVAPTLGGDAALKRLRSRLRERGMGLVLDFVSNHTARDHAWVAEHPDYYVQGGPEEDREKPELFFRTSTVRGERVIAFGRDPYFPGWTDTAQLNYRHPGLRRAVIGELRRIAGMCDGLRCDMAMLILRDVFLKTWGVYTAVQGEEPGEEFWREAIGEVSRAHPGFLFIAEAYWNLEWELQQLGFAFTYDKVLYDRLLREGAVAVRDHLRAGMEYQRRSVRFLENHDEPPAARAFPSEAWHFAAAVVVATIPGMLLLHDGQMESRPVRSPVQLLRRPRAEPNERTLGFYHALLRVIGHPVFRRGSWTQLCAREAWHENSSFQDFIVFWWRSDHDGDRLVVVNYAPRSSQSYVDLPIGHLAGHALEFRDLMSLAFYRRDRAVLQNKGMFFDLPPYAFHMFEVTPA